MQRLIIKIAVCITIFFLVSHLKGEETGKLPWDPQGYAENSKWAKISANQVIESFSWKGNESILDVGCGDGLVCSKLALKVPNGFVHGIDTDSGMIDYAKKHFSSLDYPNLSFELGDAMAYETMNCFDVITSFTAMHLVPDQEKAMKNFAHFLKPGGHILLKFPVNDTFSSALQKTLLLPQWFEKFKNHNPGWYFHGKEDYEILDLFRNSQWLYSKEVYLLNQLVWYL